jgi:anti-anti-sigma regulatory factor
MLVTGRKRNRRQRGSNAPFCRRAQEAVVHSIQPSHASAEAHRDASRERGSVTLELTGFIMGLRARARWGAFMLCQDLAIALQTSRLTHREAFRLSNYVLRSKQAQTMILDFSSVEEITTSAFARLVLLRRELLRRGRDLRLTGLHERVARLYEFNRLDAVLPLVA